ncbi:plant cysteine oxidase 3 [Andrographis paniculata]|uniref:plant cysteine oxidase 3 n=1 Tax=Andrographis paniculata TaxID=175694 RepID=UPI0021E7A285|nr:plant cysteine oxidase 3 [Andrographis paniculata]
MGALRSLSRMAEQHKPSSAIQALYDLCRDTFTPSASSYPPPPTAIEKLTSLLDTIGPADVGLSDASKEDDRGRGPFGILSFSRVDRWAQPINYVDIHEGENFTMCMFCFPTSAVIPLHDHPGMTVFSKVLYGSLHVKAYDWVEPACIRKIEGNNKSSVTVRLAKLAADKVLTAPCNTSVLYPRRGGNLHAFTAVTPCAILDILAPPYDDSAGRKCSYYHDYPCPISPLDEDGSGSGKDEEYAWLSEIDTPPDLHMVSRNYAGPSVKK